MKKIILTTIATAAFSASAFAAQTGQTYLKGGLGYNFNNAVAGSKQPDEGATFDEFKNKKPKAFAGTIGAGYMLNDMLGVEAFIDHTSGSKKIQRR